MPIVPIIGFKYGIQYKIIVTRGHGTITNTSALKSKTSCTVKYCTVTPGKMATNSNNFIHMPTSNNIFTLFLKRLKIKHTPYYSDKLYNEHPHKNNLFGLSDMLTVYGIKNGGFRIERKEDIYNVASPFIAYVGGDFAVVDAISPEQTNYIWKGKSISISTSEFLKIWSGVFLIAEPDKESVEPNYKHHRFKETVNKAKNYIAVISLASAFFIACITAKAYAHIDLLVLIMLLLNLTGIYIGYLLLLKHLHIKGGYGDKICSLFKQTDCNNILESDAASLFGIISWSEIGLSYFISNVVIILFFPYLSVWMALINICALPYSLWSIWYQRFKAKQWCPLCVMVQLLMWSLFIVNLLKGFIGVPVFDVWHIGITACVYLIPLLTIHTLSPLVTNKRLIVQVTQEINSIKANEKVFITLLHEQVRHDVSPDYSHVLLGHPSARLFVTILTNPHCNPCAKMHERIGKLLKKNPQIQVQYIFSSFSPKLEVSARYLIAVYLQKDREEREKIYNEWYKSGKINKEAFFLKYPVDMNNEAVTEEFNLHKAWIKRSQFRATPTVLVNGYKLPVNYMIEDLKYFTDPDFEIN